MNTGLLSRADGYLVEECLWCRLVRSWCSCLATILQEQNQPHICTYIAVWPYSARYVSVEKPGISGNRVVLIRPCHQCLECVSDAKIVYAPLRFRPSSDAVFSLSLSKTPSQTKCDLREIGQFSAPQRHFSVLAIEAPSVRHNSAPLSLYLSSA